LASSQVQAPNRESWEFTNERKKYEEERKRKDDEEKKKREKDFNS